MSDFDKEAEREKLREKYEQDQEKREATEQMSELLLQGATMTNAHCSDCGDPIFRYDGQEFCPTCEKAVEREGAGEDGQGIEVTETSDTGVAFGGADGQQEAATPDETTPAAADARDGQAEQQAASPSADQSQRRQARGEAANVTEHGQRPRQQPTPDVEGGVPAARDALVETLVRFSERAAASEDPRRATDNLEAAREAAAALRELDR